MMTRKIIDTHTHILDDSFNKDRKEVLEDAFSGGIKSIIEISDTLNRWDAAIKFSQRAGDNIYIALGDHPHCADGFCSKNRGNEFEAAFLEKKHVGRIVAMGEVGLDYFKNYSDPKNQRAAFARQLEVWQKADTALIIHCRDSENDMYAMLKEFVPGAGVGKGVIHCFSGSVEFAEKIINLGFFIGIDGPVTYPKNNVLRDIVKEAGLKNILLETDCPYLSPIPFRGKRNKPSYLAYVAEEVGRICGKSVDEVAEVTTKNACELFRLE